MRPDLQASSSLALYPARDAVAATAATRRQEAAAPGAGPAAVRRPEAAVAGAEPLPLRRGEDAALRADLAAARRPAAPQGGAPAEVTPEEAAELAASALYGGREVAVSSFVDETTGRQVYQIADRTSGEVLSQSPPEALLRLYAAMRAEQQVPQLVAQA
ncbi:hypothetical protein SH611_13305 [Geminicoccaceae bacterium 1502E]|nr:hypothetical protein [Geminicoccaceae bacterium 1502E]